MKNNDIVPFLQISFQMTHVSLMAQKYACRLQVDSLWHKANTLGYSFSHQLHPNDSDLV